jgi:hypothetical protein
MALSAHADSQGPPLGPAMGGAWTRWRLSARWALGSLIALTLGAALALALHPGARGERSLPAAQGFGRLPLAARARISDLIGGGVPSFAIHGLRGVNRAQRLRISFSERGASIASGSGRVGITLAALGYGGKLLNVSSAAPHARANTVTYAHGAVREWFANGPLGLEQGFDLPARPAGGAGPLTLSLKLSGGMTTRLSNGDVLLAGHGARLRYGGLVATDARGRVLPASLALAPGGILIRVEDRGATYPLRIDPLVQQAVLAPSTALQGSFGYSSAISGKTIVVGDPPYESERGAAYVFEEPTSGGWADATETKLLIAEDGKASNDFGLSVAITGNTLVVGAPYDKTATTYASGAVYIFEAPSGDWKSAKQVAQLTVPDVRENKQHEIEEVPELQSLGTSVAISGSTVVAGAPGRNGNQGAAYVFVKPGGGWKSTSTFTAKLHETAAAFIEKACPDFGQSIAMSGGTVVVGAPGQFFASTNCEFHHLPGAAYVFVEPKAGWSGELESTDTLTPSGSAPEDKFGSSVALSELARTIVVGSPEQTVGASAGQGAAYVFEKPGAGWTGSPAQTELTDPHGAAAEEFGHSVAVAGEGGTVFVGATGFGQYYTEKTSGVYAFTMPEAGWSGTGGEPEKIGTPEIAYGLGYSLADEGSTLLAASGGHAYVFVPGLGITISSPGNGATYTPGQTVLAAYSCSAPPKATVKTCEGPVAKGAPIDTSTLGIHTFTVEYEDSEGNKAKASSVYRVASPPSTEEATSTTGTTPTTALLTPAQKAAAEAAKKAALEKESAEFCAYILAAMSNPENAAIGAKLLKEGGIPVSYKLVPEPGLIATTGSTITWNKPTGSTSRVSSRHKPKPVVVFNVNYRVVKAGPVSFKILLTSAGRRLLKADLKARRSLTIYWTVTYTPQNGRPARRTFKVTLKPARAKKRR